MESIERILAALERLIRRYRTIDALSLEAVASEAHVTRQAAYRYFRDVKDVVRLFARRIQTVGHELLAEALTAQRFETEMELAETAVSFIVDTCRQIFSLPPRIRAQVMRDHVEICYGLVWTIAETVAATMSNRGDPCAGVGVVALNGALVSVISVAVSLCFKGENLVSSEGSHALMLDIFLAAIGGIHGPVERPR